MKTILITGVAGYIGSKLCEFLLKKKFKVIGLDNFHTGNKKAIKEFTINKNFKFFQEDIINIDKIQKNFFDFTSKIDCLIHLAAIVGDPASKKEPELCQKTNYNASRKIYDFYKRKKIKKFIFSSTCSNYGKNANDEYVDENSKLLPLSTYAETKVKFENFLIKSSTKDSNISILRFATVYGVARRNRFDLTINQFTRDIFFKKKLEIFGQDLWRPYCHVNDICLSIIFFIDNISKFKNTIYNVGLTKENYTKFDIVNLISKYLDVSNVTFVKNKNNDYRNYKVNFNKINEDTNISFFYNIEKGIQELINFLKKKDKKYFYKKEFVN